MGEKFADARRRIEVLEEQRLQACYAQGQCVGDNDMSENLFEGNFDIVNDEFCRKLDRGSPAAPPGGHLMMRTPPHSPAPTRAVRLDAEDCDGDAELAGESVFLDSPQPAAFREVRTEMKTE